MKDTLRKYFGYDEFRPPQEEIIEAIIEGRNVLAVLPTGSGKSLCYQYPALVAEGFSIVISPLIALMKDQTDSLNKNGEIAGFINSTLNYAESEEVLRKINSGNIKLLYLAPEKLENKEFVERVRNMKPDYLFVDEAHCISQWGHNFRPSYSKIKSFATLLDVKRISAFTATATLEVMDDIIHQLGFKNPVRFVHGFRRDNIAIQVMRAEDKKEAMLNLINSLQTPAIVYISRRKDAEEAAEYLNSYGIKSAYYHGGMLNEERRLVQDKFINDEVGVICATNAFGMGIDKKDIRLIIHYNMPGSIENYYQEIGRAGRDGLASNAVMLYHSKDKSIHEYFISTSYPSAAIIKNIYNGICDSGSVALGSLSTTDIKIRINYLSNYLNTRLSMATVQSAISALERSGYLREVSDSEKKYYIQFNLTLSHLKHYIDTVENQAVKDVVTLLLRTCGNSLINTKTPVNIAKLAASYGVSSEYFKEMLSWLHNIGVAEFEQPIEDYAVRMTSTRVNDRYLIIDTSQIEIRRKHAEDRLSAIENFADTGICRMRYIAEYFGETGADNDCGKCDNCLKDAAQIKFKPKPSLQPTGANIDYENILELYNKLREVRSQVASKFQQAPYMICPDEVLRAVAEAKPVTTGDLMRVRGFNQRMFNKAGHDFLECIKEYESWQEGENKAWSLNDLPQDRQRNKRPDKDEQISQTYKLVKEGFTLKEISRLREIPESVIAMQIETILEYYPETSIKTLFENGVDEDIISEMNKGYIDLKDLHEKLKGRYDYSALRIIVAKNKSK